MLKEKYNFITSVNGTGLLLALELDEKYPIEKVEYDLIMMGLNVIHGGDNAIRLTPWFKIDKKESDLIIDILDKYFSTF